MAFTSTNFLYYEGIVDAPTTQFVGPFVSSQTVTDGDGDRQIDGNEYWGSSGNGYTGYTISIRGNEYAIFDNGAGSFAIPYDSAFDDLSDLAFTAVTQTITNSGDNTFVVNCFLTGTAIATPSGAVAIEALAPGDLVTTADGRVVPVLWVARQTLRRGAVNLADQRDRAVVRIAAGALGAGLPERDLFVSADHGMVLDGLLVNAGALVNGGDIAYVAEAELPAEITYWHIETEAHEVLLAEGAPTESFIDYRGRAAFDNFDAYLAENGAERVIREMALPRISAARLLPQALRAEAVPGRRCA